MTQSTIFYCMGCLTVKHTLFERNVELHTDPTTQAVHKCCLQCLEDPNRLNVMGERKRVIAVCPICMEDLEQVGTPHIRAELVKRAVRAAALPPEHPRVTRKKQPEPQAVAQKWEKDPTSLTPFLNATDVEWLRKRTNTLLDKNGKETEKRRAWIDMILMNPEKSQDPKQVLSALIKLIPGIDDERNLDIVGNLTALRQIISKQQPTWTILQESSEPG